MIKRKKTGCETPQFRRQTAAPPIKPLKTNPPNVGSSVQRPKQPCAYETPCGWCAKWDKECDRKPYKRVPINPVDDYIGDNWKDALVNKTCQSEEDHQWECCGISTGGSTYRCKKCNVYKNVSYPSPTIYEATLTNI